MNRLFRGSLTFLCRHPHTLDIRDGPRTLTLIFAGTFTILAGATVDAGAQPCPNPGPHQIALFEHNYYVGSCVTLGIGDYPSSTSAGISNFAVSSVKIG